MRFLRLLCFICIGILLCSCTPEQTYFGEIPNLKFSHVKYTHDGKPCYYLFDDNPEHLNKNYLADGEIPSSIAHFDSLAPGVYTIFSYHHRGSAAAKDTDMFFDVLFRASQKAEYKITKIGLDHNWQWNKAWADFTGVDVYAPEYLKTYNCTCTDSQCLKPDGACNNSNCSCTIKDELTKSNSGYYQGLNITSVVTPEKSFLLSEQIPVIKEDRVNEIRHGGYDEPIWLIMEFEILSGELTVDTLAYTDLEKAKANFETMEKGSLAKEPQYKGIADSAPIVKAELSYTFDDTTKPGALPIRIFNQRHPEGYIAKDGAFGTNVNTWKVKELIEAESAESDLMHLTYKDSKKLDLYGESITDKNHIWHFDPFYTSMYDDAGNPDFEPNIPMSQVNYPMGNKETPKDFYSKYVLNLGNFGVRYQYTFKLNNQSSVQRIFSFSMNSVSGQVYRYSLYSGNTLIKDDGGRYIMKKFDMDPGENPKSKTDPKERLEPAKYTTTEKFVLEPNTDYILNMEVVTLTGCDAPMTNILSVE